LLLQLLAALLLLLTVAAGLLIRCSFYPAHFLSTHSSLKHSLPDPLHKGGEADMRPLSLVEVNQAILAWSFYFGHIQNVRRNIALIFNWYCRVAE
jgi:hypothetical protein